tara:strand:+ start:767 stop:1075 length:309 start_codon:yes stop_codon:yes gene_type:complete
MPKFYIHDGLESTVINADSPLQACFKSIKHRFEGIPINGFYKVSEKGFENHDDDTIFSSDEVIQALLEMMSEKKKKDVDNFPNDEKKTRRKRKKPKKDEDED